MAYSASIWPLVLVNEIGRSQEVTYSITWDTTQWDPSGWGIIPYVIPQTIEIDTGDLVGGEVQITQSWITRYGTEEGGWPLITFFFNVKNLRDQICRSSIYNILIPAE